MTKYVVGSGGTRNKPGSQEKLWQELTKDLPNNPQILICLFASPREYWEQIFEERIQAIPSVVPNGITPTFELAMPNTFAEQAARADIILIGGGYDHLTQYWLKQFDLKNIFENKVVAISSASSHALSTHFWTCDWRQCFDGLGILPIKFLAHYKSSYGETDPRGPIDWENAYKELEAFGDATLPIYALEEGDFEVFGQ